MMHKLVKTWGLNSYHLNWYSTASAIYNQQKYMYDHKLHTVADRIVGFHQSFLRPIIRSKKNSQ